MTQLGFRITHVAEVRIGAQAFGVDDFAAKRLAAAIDFDAPALAARRTDTGDVGRGRGGRERHGGEKEQRSLHAASPLTLPASSRRSAPSSNGRASRDRKRVVEGKRVSVRVELGGRRISKKKNKN